MLMGESYTFWNKGQKIIPTPGKKWKDLQFRRNILPGGVSHVFLELEPNIINKRGILYKCQIVFIY